MDTKTILRLGVSLALGLLVGLQRERTESSLAGIRTFPLISLFGTMCGLLAVTLGGWVVAAGLGAMELLFVIGNYGPLQSGVTDHGMTPEIAAIANIGIRQNMVWGGMTR